MPGYDYASNKRTLILVLRYGCRYCDESLPLYKRLLELRREGQIRGVNMLAIFPDNPTVAKSVLDEEGLDISFIPSVNLAQLRIPGTPTLLLMDDKGSILEVWVGKLSEGKELDLIDHLRRPT